MYTCNADSTWQVDTYTTCQRDAGKQGCLKKGNIYRLLQGLLIEEGYHVRGYYIKDSNKQNFSIAEGFTFRVNRFERKRL